MFKFLMEDALQGKDPPPSNAQWEHHFGHSGSYKLNFHTLHGRQMLQCLFIGMQLLR